jgi:hypothetical protein
MEETFTTSFSSNGEVTLGLGRGWVECTAAVAGIINESNVNMTDDGAMAEENRPRISDKRCQWDQ